MGEEREEVEKAHQAADQAHATLDKAVAGLEGAGAGVSNEMPLPSTESTAEEDFLLSEPEAQQKLLDAREHFAAVDASFAEQQYVADVAKKLYVALPPDDQEALASAQREAAAAQKSLDEAAALVRRLEAQTLSLTKRVASLAL